MANVLVCVELRAARATAASLFAIAEARRVADRLGATVFAMAVTGAAGLLGDTLPAALGPAGVDRILLVEDPVAADCPVFPLWRGLFDQVVQALRPRLVIFPAGSFGLQLGPPLAAAIAAAFIPRAALEITSDNGSGLVLLAHRWTADLSGRLAIDLGATSAPAVLTLTSAWPERRPSERADEAELQVLAAPAQRTAAVQPLESHPAPHADVDLADTVVLVPPGQPQLLASLSEAAPPGTVVLDGQDADVLRDAAPRLVLLLASKPLLPALSGLRLGPDAHLAVAGTRRTVPPGPLADRLWLVKRSEVGPKLRAAFAGGKPTS